MTTDNRKEMNALRGNKAVPSIFRSMDMNALTGNTLLPGGFPVRETISIEKRVSPVSSSPSGDA
jgi:hypothetical protein